MIEKQAVYTVHLKKKTAKDKNRCFVVTDKRVDLGASVFHARGYWAEKPPALSEADDGGHILKVHLETSLLKDVWIPWENIDHVENLTYIGR